MTGADPILIETERLVLRPPRLADLEETFELWADPVVVKFITGKPSTREEAWGRLHRNAGYWALQGYGPLMAREKASGRFVGELGLNNFGREIDPPTGPLEAGWVLASWCHRKGYASEAMLACLDWARARFAGQRSTCIIDPYNAPSLGVARKCGYREFTRADLRGSAVVMLERTI